MAKIENWSKLNDATWQNDENGYMLKVKKIDLSRKTYYNIELHSPKNSSRRVAQKIDTKEKAVNQARTWMNYHPEPYMSQF